MSGGPVFLNQRKKSIIIGVNTWGRSDNLKKNWATAVTNKVLEMIKIAENLIDETPEPNPKRRKLNNKKKC